ncbi:two-component sensor histidine kinase, partial [Pseudoalteromonas ruthenica]
MRPLKQLERATERFASGQLNTRIHDKISSTDGEFQQIAATFDQMANCIEHTIESQRQFIADFSHEIRTPIARV